MIKRRQFIAGIGSAAVWPMVAQAQPSVIPIIAYLSVRSAESDRSMMAAFRRGLNQLGFEEGRNLTIEYRFAGGQYDLVPALVTEVVGRRVNVIVFVGAGSDLPDSLWRELRASQIPIVANAIVPGLLSNRLVSSYNRPGGNITGIAPLATLPGKYMSLLHDLVPNATTIAMLRNNRAQAEVEIRQAATTLGLQLLVLEAGTDGEIDAAFAALNQQQVDAMLVITSAFFVTRAKQIAALAARHGVPAIYPRREFAEAGGLLSYGYDVADGYRQMGNYAGRTLKGEKAGDLPVFQPTKFELVINLKTAKALGFEIPVKVLALADEVIE
jgi:putative tryptophan/tyrosine transport system substrate-binding protein